VVFLFENVFTENVKIVKKRDKNFENVTKRFFLHLWPGPVGLTHPVVEHWTWQSPSLFWFTSSPPRLTDFTLKYFKFSRWQRDVRTTNVELKERKVVARRRLCRLTAWSNLTSGSAQDGPTSVCTCSIPV